VPMISRILQLLMIDILAVGVVMRRPAQAAAEPAAAGAEEAPDAATGRLADSPPPTPGVSTASPLSRMTLHSR